MAGEPLERKSGWPEGHDPRRDLRGALKGKDGSTSGSFLQLGDADERDVVETWKGAVAAAFHATVSGETSGCRCTVCAVETAAYVCCVFLGSFPGLIRSRRSRRLPDARGDPSASRDQALEARSSAPRRVAESAALGEIQNGEASQPLASSGGV